MRLFFCLLFMATGALAQHFPHKVKDKDQQDNNNYLYERIRSLNSGSAGSASGPYILKTAAFGGDVSGTYDALCVTDDSHNHDLGTLPTVNSVLGAHEVFRTTATLKIDAG